MKKVLKSSFILILVTVSVSAFSVQFFSSVSDEKLNKLIMTPPSEESSGRQLAQEPK